METSTHAREMIRYKFLHMGLFSVYSHVVESFTDEFYYFSPGYNIETKFRIDDRGTSFREVTLIGHKA